MRPVVVVSCPFLLLLPRPPCCTRRSKSRRSPLTTPSTWRAKSSSPLSALSPPSLSFPRRHLRPARKHLLLRHLRSFRMRSLRTPTRAIDCWPLSPHSRSHRSPLRLRCLLLSRRHPLTLTLNPPTTAHTHPRCHRGQQRRPFPPSPQQSPYPRPLSSRSLALRHTPKRPRTRTRARTQMHTPNCSLSILRRSPLPLSIRSPLSLPRPPPNNRIISPCTLMWSTP
jgi:hypothetical protein